MVSERAAFVQAIEENPYDEVTRKVFADWLDDHDEPEEADRQRTWTAKQYDESKKWLEEFAECVGLKYSEVIAAGIEGFYCTGENYDPQDELDARNGVKEFWKHWSVAVDRLIDPKLHHGNPFYPEDEFDNCSC